MDTDVATPIELLSEEDCWESLHASNLGRLALSVANEPSIYPVSFMAAGRRLLFRTSPGTKLAELTVNSHVAFEIDGVGADDAWSVVVKGTARSRTSSPRSISPPSSHCAPTSQPSSTSTSRSSRTR